MIDKKIPNTYKLRKKEYGKLTSLLGHKPSGWNDFLDKGYKNLYTTLSKRKKLAKYVGHEFNTEDKSHEKIKQQYKELTVLLGRKPDGLKDFQDNGYFNLYEGLRRNRNIAKHLGHEFKDTQTRIYELRKKEYGKLVEKLNREPNVMKDFDDNGFRRLYQYLSAHKKVAKEFGYEFDNGDSKRYEFRKEQYKKLVQKLGHKPSGKKDFDDNGFGGLYQYLNIHKKNAELIGYEFYDKNEKNSLIKKLKKEQYDKLTQKLGHSPTRKDFIDNGFNYLYTYLLNHKDVAEEFGYVFFKDRREYKDKKPPGFWKNWDNLKEVILPEIELFNSENGRLPLKRELEEKFKKHLILKYYGGIKEVYSKLGYLPSNPTSENFINFVENNDVAKIVVEKLGNDRPTMGDVFHLIYEGDVSKKELYSLLNGATLGVWLGNADYGIRSPRDIVDLGKAVLPFDKNEKIKGILQNLSYQLRRDKLGPIPTEDSRKSFKEQLIEELHEV